MAIKKTWRGLVSLTMFVSGFISAVTGIVLYIVPAGRIANWVIWDLFGLSKEAWQGIHTLSSYLLLIFGILHIINNWKSIKNYVVSKSGSINMKREMSLATLFSVIIIFSAVLRLPPLIWVMDLGEYLKESWVVSPEFEPPFGHAEELSLKAFCMRMDIDPEKAKNELTARGIAFESDKEQLKTIAENNSITPMDLYIAIKPFEQKIELEVAKTWTEEQIEAEFAGKGLGRKTFEQLTDQLGMEFSVAKGKLAAFGIEIEADSLMKDVKAEYEMIKSATDIIKALLIEGYTFPE